MKKIDELIAKFKEFKEELNKNVNMSYASKPNMPVSGGMVKGGMASQDMMAMSEKMTLNKMGQWSISKTDGTNTKANPSGNHNKSKFKVMPMAEERGSKKESVAGKPYTEKAEGCAKCNKSPCTCEQFDDNKGRGTSP